MRLSDFRPCQEPPLNSGAFFEVTDTELTQPIYTPGHVSWARKRLIHYIPPGHRREILSKPVPSGPILGLEPKGKGNRKVRRVPQPCFFPVPSDRISASSPRVVGDARARALCADMKRCSYYETCATYGLNVDRVFQEGKCGDPSIYEKQGARGLGYS